MHWTAFLAYRRFPAHARVIDDLPCVKCGYNLRSALANGQCPECGELVGNSLFVLNKPEIVGSAVRTIGYTYLGFLVFSCAILPLSATWPVIVIFGVMALVGLVRAVAAWELRFRGAINALPVVGRRAAILWWLALLDVILACGNAVLYWVAARLMFVSKTFEEITTFCTVLWMVVHVVGALQAGWFGTALATMLWFTWARWELIAHRVMLAIGVALLCIVAMSWTGTRGPGFVVSSTLALVVISAGMALTTAGLVHLGNGAQSETDTWDDLVDVDPHGPYTRPEDISKPEPPAIRID